MSDIKTMFGGGVMAVTGGASGVGEGMARYGATLGMKIAIGDIDLAAAEAVAAELRSAGTEAIAVHADVRDADSVDAFVARAYAELGPVTLGINNAGIEQFGYLWETPVQNWQRLLDINLTGVFNGIRAMVPRMAAAEVPASIWNLSSIGGLSPAPRQAPYIVSKHAVLALTECLKLEVDTAGYDIRVGVVIPGPVTSQIFERAGGSDEGDTEAGAAERQAMLAVKEISMPAIEAAEQVFTHAAEGKFYLHTHPEMSAGIMSARAESLRTQAAPQLAE